jgi:hypothetical protein
MPGGEALQDGSVTTVVEALERRLAEDLLLRWHDLRAVEIVLDKMADASGGEDPLKPANRLLLDGSRQALLDIHGYLAQYTDAPELTEPDEELLATVLRLVVRGSRG